MLLKYEKALIYFLFSVRKLSKLTHFTFRGNELSPIKHLYLKNVDKERSEKVDLLDKIVDKVLFHYIQFQKKTLIDSPFLLISAFHGNWQ